MDAWRKRDRERTRIKKRNFDQGGYLRSTFDTYARNFELGKELITECHLEYINLVEDLETTRKVEKTINDFLALIPENNVIMEFGDLEKIIDYQALNWKKELKVLESFASLVK